MTTYTATYSPEDNKLRLYATSRLDAETYQKIKNVGFRWAPKQKLFVAPAWAPEREDILLELAGEIEPEEMTLAERAETKAARLDDAIEKKIKEADAFSCAANAISERFAGGQPILIGHHSERKARRDQEKIDRAMRNASAAMERARDLSYRIEGVEAHANHKNCPDVRARRIKTLLAELRDLQRKINHGHMLKNLWERIAEIEYAEQRKKTVGHYVGSYFKEGRASYINAYDDFESGKKTPDEIIKLSLDYADRWINSKSAFRWIEHTLNRLSYERGELGQTKRYDGPLKATTIQAFAREQGAHKPEAQKTETGFILRSEIPLPLHIGDGPTIELTENGWRDLMQSAGYEVPEKKAGSANIPPLLNLNVASIKVRAYRGAINKRVVSITKAEYAAMPPDYKRVKYSECGAFRVRCGFAPGQSNFETCLFFLTDSKAHEIPDSPSIILKKENAA